MKSAMETVVENAIETALGEFAVSDSNPCGGTGYYDLDEDLPFRVLFCDSVQESFKTLDDAMAAAASRSKGIIARKALPALADTRRTTKANPLDS